MGTLLKVSGDFTDTTLPKISPKDRVITEGSLLLVDASHSLGGLGTLGVPVDSGLIPNIAWEEAFEVLGTGSETSLSCVFSDNHQAADALFERSSKGGLHGIYSQVNNTNDNRGAGINAPQEIENYIVANKEHSFYMSVWTRRTRSAADSTPRFSIIGDAGNFICGFGAGGSISATLIDENFDYVGPNSVGLSYRSIAATTLGDVNAQVWPMFWGNFLSGQATYNNKAASDVFYRCYIEDLTVSGRTFDEVDALDKAYYDECFGAGGKYDNDTFTDPSVKP